jgi:transcriptional regulator NrdR family protein
MTGSTRGQVCPVCNGDSEVLNVKHRGDGATVRYRRCLWNRKHRWTTTERINPPRTTSSNDKHAV